MSALLLEASLSATIRRARLRRLRPSSCSLKTSRAIFPRSRTSVRVVRRTVLVTAEARSIIVGDVARSDGGLMTSREGAGRRWGTGRSAGSTAARVAPVARSRQPRAAELQSCMCRTRSCAARHPSTRKASDRASMHPGCQPASPPASDVQTTCNHQDPSTVRAIMTVDNSSSLRARRSASSMDRKFIPAWGAAIVVAGLGCSNRVGSVGEIPTSSVSGVKVGAKRVTGKTTRESFGLVEIAAGSSEVLTTPEHRFAKAGVGWIKAAEVKLGDRLVTRTGAVATVREYVLRLRPRGELVYNLSVQGAHAYFVSRGEILVHNTCGRHVNDLEDPRSRLNNCAYCSLAALKGITVREYLRDLHPLRMDPGGLYPDSVVHELSAQGLVDDTTTPGRYFDLHSIGPEWESEALNFLHGSMENTFFFFFQAGAESHAVIAIRRRGEIRFVDFQDRPPRVYSQLPGPLHEVAAYPVNVDWRSNPKFWDLF